MNDIVFFDGHCGLCNKAVDFILKRDQKNYFKFSPLQGQYIQSLISNPAISLNLKAVDLKNLNTIYVYDGHQFYSKTKAIRRIAKGLGGGWAVLAFCSQILPLFVCDWIYDRVAANRYRFFGQSEHCRVPTKAQQQKFIS